MLDFFYGVVLLFEVILSIVIGLFVIQRNKADKLNRVFLIVMIGFAGYLFSESIIYLLGIEDLAIIDILRDVMVACSTVSTILLVFTALIVQHGGDVIEKPRNIIIGIISSIVLVLVGIPFDGADASFDSYVIFVQTGEFAIIGKITLLIIPVILLLFAMFQYMMVRRSSADPVLRNQLLRLALGIGLITVGVIYFVLFPLFRYPGHISYITGLLMLLWAFK